MANLFFLFFLADVVLYAASQYQRSGHPWADAICTNAFGLCNYSQWLLLAVVPLFVATYLAHKRRQN